MEKVNLPDINPPTENYVLQQLRGQFGLEPRYYSDKNREIDFLIQNGAEITPVEVKGGEDKSAPFLSTMLQTVIRDVQSATPNEGIRFTLQGRQENCCKTKYLLHPIPSQCSFLLKNHSHNTSILSVLSLYSYHLSIFTFDDDPPSIGSGSIAPIWHRLYLVRHTAFTCTISKRRWLKLAVLFMGKKVFVSPTQHICGDPFAEQHQCAYVKRQGILVSGQSNKILVIWGVEIEE